MKLNLTTNTLLQVQWYYTADLLNHKYVKVSKVLMIYSYT